MSAVVPNRAQRSTGSATPDLTVHAVRTRAAVTRLQLSRAHLLQLIGDLADHHSGALDFLLGETSSARRPAVRAVLERLEDRLGVNLGSEELAGPSARVGRRVADFVGAVVGVMSIYLVVGGLVEGDSLLLGDSGRLLGLPLFVAVLAILATFEALHVSAAMLKIADLGALADRYPRAAALHRRFRTDNGLARFLAGRQMVVVVTVFFCSSLSSFPHLTRWPFTDATLPGPVRALVFVGMPGALSVLWFGQLIPQFLATRHAVRLTNSRACGVAFRVAYALEAVGLARVGFWGASWDRATETIPSSPALRWKQSAEEIDGFGAVGIVRDWVIDATTRLHAVSALRVCRDATAAITDSSMLVPGTPARLAYEADGTQADGSPRGLVPADHREEPLATGDRRFHQTLASTTGSFSAGDILRVTLDAEYPPTVGQDLVLIDRPTRFLVFRVCPSAMPEVMRAGTVRIFAVGDGIADLVEVGPAMRLNPVVGGNGLPMLEHIILFPRPNTLVVFDWEVKL